MPSGDVAPLALDAGAQRLLTAALSRRPRGLFTDVDGTISAIAPTPETAVLLPGMRELLVESLHVFDMVAAISGRTARDARRLVGVPELTYIGNHGLERFDPLTKAGKPNTRVRVHVAARPYVHAINALMDNVARTLAPRFPGLRIERKGVTGSVHVRNTEDPKAAEAAVAEVVAEAAAATGLRVTRGKLVVEVRPPIEVDKGTILTDLVRRHALASALYLGDDRTDIDAFRALHRLTAEGVCQGVAIAVQHAEAPANLAGEADLVLHGVEQVPSLLRWLLKHA